MFSMLVAAALIPVQYEFKPGQKIDYELVAKFDGFVPVLGGQEGRIQVDMGVHVEGVDPKDAKLQGASSEIQSFELSFNGAKLPLTLDSIKDYFPKTTISMTPFGKIAKTDAPDVKLPVRLPGLDVKRFPDISYLPIEFPEAGLDVDTQWAYDKTFGDSPVHYTCKVARLNDDVVEIGLTMNQKYSLLENESLEIVTDEKDAVASAETSMSGTGKATFDRKSKLVTKFEATGLANTKLTDLKTKKESERKLTSTILVQIKKPKT